MRLQTFNQFKKSLSKYLSFALCILMMLSLVACGDDKAESYRIIKLVEMSGDVSYTRDSKTSDAYQNMNFENGDAVSTGNESSAKLSLDSDKFLYMGANTAIEMEARGNETDSQTTIKLNSGEVTNEIQNKLSSDSMYEIKTSNAVMAVQGTIFYVKVKDGKTIVYCEDGQIKVSAVGGSDASILEPQQAAIVEGATINSVPVEDILDEMSDGTTIVLQHVLDLLGDTATSDEQNDDEDNPDSNHDDSDDSNDSDDADADSSTDSGYSLDDLAKVPGEPSGTAYDLYCACGAKVVCTTYTPTGFSIMGTGNIETDYGFRKLAVVFNPFPGVKNVSITTDDYIIATTAFTGSYPGSLQDFEFTVYDLAPVNNGSECKLIKYSYFDAEGWQKTFHFATIVVKYDSCDGQTRGLTLKFQLDGDSIDWTLEDYQRIAYETFGR